MKLENLFNREYIYTSETTGKYREYIYTLENTGKYREYIVT